MEGEGLKHLFASIIDKWLKCSIYIYIFLDCSNSPEEQWSSSLLSPQSFTPSHSQNIGMQSALSHIKELSGHTVKVYG